MKGLRFDIYLLFLQLDLSVLKSDKFSYSIADNGSMHLWDWKTGYNFQRVQAAVQPGSLDSEAGIFSMTFDMSGCRLITTEADKTIKIYKEDDTAVNQLFVDYFDCANRATASEPRNRECSKKTFSQRNMECSQGSYISLSSDLILILRELILPRGLSASRLAVLSCMFQNLFL